MVASGQTQVLYASAAVNTSSSGRHSVRISGLSTIDFRAGFARKPTLDFKKTLSRPVQGIPTFVLLNTTGITPPGRADRLELLSISGAVLKTIPIRFYPERHPYGIWNITEFIPPNEAFFMKVTGNDKDNFLFQRVSSVSFYSITPEAPKVTMPARTPGYYLQGGTISCSVESLIPFTLRFSRGGTKLGMDQFFRESADVSWEIARVTVEDEGYYECIAINSVGTGRAQTYLDVSEPPPTIKVASNVTVTPGDRAVLTCLTSSTVRYNLTWQRNSADAGVNEPSRVRIMSNLSLEIRNVKPSDVGEYSCIAANEGGVTVAGVYLTVQEPPQVSVEPRNQTFIAGQEVQIRCSARGYPTPQIVWTHNDMFIMGSIRHRLIPDGTLIIGDTVQSHSGVYSCLASNPAGTDRQTSILTYIEAPKVTVVQKEILIGLGDTTVMECKATGIPDPEVQWYKGDLQLRPSEFVSIDSLHGILRIKETQDVDAGDYTCVAINDAGRTRGKVTLDVGSAPEFTQEPIDVSADIGSNIGLQCQAQGYPQPRIKWRRLDNASLFSRPLAVSSVSQKRTGSLVINNLWIDDETTYICEAENQFGRIQKQATVTVTGLVTPVIGISPAVVNVIEGQQVTLPCVLLSGKPLPERRWLRNDGVLSPSPYLTIRRDGSLHIERVRLQDGGEYTCVARNVAGTNNRTTSVKIFVLPTMQHGPQVFNTIEGVPITLPCRASGVPKPDITWSKKGQLIDLSGSSFSLVPDGSLHIASPTGEETGEFLCTATNAAGYTSRKVQLTVYVPPKIQAGPHVIKVQVGHTIDIPCITQGVPSPVVSWLKDGLALLLDGSQFSNTPEGTLTISGVTLSDAGFYKCIASNTAGRDEAEIELQVQVSWLKDGLALLLDGSQFSNTPEGTLTISGVTLSDAGFYKCIASNTAGRDEAEIELQVQVPPVVEDLEPPYNTPFQERVANQRIAFPCPAKGTPKPTIKWLRNGQELTGNEPGVSIQDDDTLLIIASVSPHDNGEYVCVAINDAGTTERKYQLKVHGKTLRLLKATTRDTGRYSCKAINIAGSSEKQFNLDVLVPPSITDSASTSEVSVILNHEASLECKVKGVPFPTIQWYKDNKLLFLGDPNVEVLNKGQVLKIKSARLGDQGRYQCSVANTAGKQTKDFKLNVFVPPSIKGGNVTTELSALLNTPVTLECEARGVPLPAITWFKDGRPLTSSPQALYVDRGQFLQIPQVQVSDAGRYTCRVTSVAGNAEKPYKLDVYVPPTIEGDSDAPKEKKVLVSNSVTLECEAGGHPPPTLTWLKDGAPVKTSGNVRILKRGKKIEILNAVVSDSGSYVCVATSVAGEKEIRYNINVLVPPSVEGGDETTDTTVILNSPLELECRARGTPPPHITWLKDGQPVRQKQGVKIVSNGSKLLIARAQVSDTGRYQCVATNEAGDHMREFDVSVLGSSERSVVVHKPITLQCAASGIPNPAITWLKDGRPVNTASGNIKLESAGRVLQIVNSQLEDAGRYTCVTTNAAGEAQQHIQLNVQEPPTIENGGETLNETIIINSVIQLECKAFGNPLPAITWYKDSRPITSAAGVTLLNRGQILQIDNAQMSDTGIYKCAAINAAGTTELVYSLQVYVPPSISGSSDMVAVVVNNPVRLECEARGIPAPSLTWLKDGSPVSSFSDGVQVLYGGRVLAITSAQISDTGKYTCVAVNAAGEEQRDIDLRVYVPPNIMGEEQNVSVVISQVVVLQCQSNAIPPSTLRWLKDGRPLFRKPGLTVSGDGSTLKIDGAQVQDMGRYTCEATNVAGKTEKNYNLKVWGNSESLEMHILSGGSKLQIARSQLSDSGTYTCVASNVEGKAHKNYFLTIQVPPNITGSEMSSEASVLVNETVKLVCSAEGIPRPTIKWLKDGKKLNVTEARRIRVSPDGSTLSIIGVQTADIGKYTCVATNLAGEEDRIFNLNVYVPPSIQSNGKIPDELTAILDSSINIECVATGSPPPQLNWLKNGLPLPISSQIRLLSAGQVLRIVRAQVSDTGTYTCVASNRAGVNNKHYNLQVYVSPSLDNARGSEDVTVVRGNPTALLCISDGTPTPTLAWLKDGLPLQLSTQTTVLNQGMALQITQTGVEDTGRYTCIASNEAGEDSKHFNLQVLDPPRINGSDFPEEVSVIVNYALELLCISTGIPAPKLTWMKDGRPLPQTDGIRVLRGGEVLRIASAQVEDTGRYTCLASSPAGDDDKEFLVRVHVPPNIAGTSAPQDLSVLQNRQVILECKSDAVPPPTLTWLKDGEPLQATPRVRILSNGRYLQINNAELGDGAQYTCVASNIAGTTTREFNLAVHAKCIAVPPSIADEATELLVTKLSPAVISCTASGVPEPTIHWSKDGAKLLPHGEGYRILPTGPVEISTTQLSHTGRYTCVARNAAGSAHRHVHLTVQETPLIQTHPSTTDVILNNPITLPCEATGTPRPTISWQKEGINILTTRGSFTLLPNGALQIARAKLEDAGTYMCVAQNPAGTALGKTKLRVQVPPVIVSQSKSYTVALDKSVPLLCEAQGYPAPEVIWHKDGHLVTESVRLRVLSSGALQITFAQPSDTGRYTCTVANVAGSSNIEMSLIVHVPPTIRSSETEYSVIESSQMVLPCVADGVPQPLISWQKEEVPLSDTLGKYTVMQSGELLVDNAQPDDTGSFTCVASNVVGQDSKTMSLTVHVHPAFTELLEDASLNKGERLMLSCGAVGVPTPRITWAFNNNIVPAQFDNVNGHSELVIERVSKDDSGTYACIAENSVGSIKSIGFVYVKEPPIIDGDFHSNRIEPLGGNAILNCEVRGDPPPTILWSKKGVNIQISNRIRQLDNGSLAIYGTVNEDGGSYMCIATNDAGMVERSVTLTLQSSPTVMVEPVETVVDAGTTVVLNCQADGEPPPTIEWSRQGRPLLGDDRITILSNNSLRLTRAQKEDTSEYECVARNLLGSVIVRVPVTVQVHGGFSEWLEWAPCSVTCGQGVQKRLRQCNNPLPANGGQHCLGADTETRSCQSKPCPVAGNWGAWLPWGPCSETCGKGTQTRLRLCNNPPPSFDGPHCEGQDAQTQVCKERHCPVDGKWTSWVSWAACSVSCGGGTRQRTRACASPSPQYGGRQCEGNDVHIDFCNSEPCPNIDECRDGTHQCRYNQICENTRGSYHCTCPHGYRSQGVGRPCLDINECERVPTPCAYQCLNTPGSFKCLCPPGRQLLGDGKSCAGLEKLPIYGSYSDGYRQAQFSPVGNHYQRQYHNLASQTYNTNSGYSNVRAPFSRAHRNTRETCPEGFQARAGRCIDINECETKDACQHECMNIQGSYKCLCPAGYRLMANGKTCQDIDECLEQNIQCGANRMCFNMRGSYQCIDTPCPPNYQRDPATGFCLKNCPPNDLECALSPYALEYKLVSLPFGIAANQDLIRLVAYTQDGIVHPRTTFLVVDEDLTIPFAIREENLKGVVFTIRPLREPHTYRMKVRASSYSVDGGIEYQTTFIVYIAVSAYPY
ncbi:UNVERIFIED_CONTAM: hypothetical protein FKN15_020671 [Acipenser sinensis]